MIAWPVVLCMRLVRATPLSNASIAARRTGKYWGRQPAMTALIAAWRTVHVRSRCSWTMSTSSGARVVVARNSSTNSWIGGTTGRPSLQPCS
jgi:hypothetical protein